MINIWNRSLNCGIFLKYFGVNCVAGLCIWSATKCVASFANVRYGSGMWISQRSSECLLSLSARLYGQCVLMQFALKFCVLNHFFWLCQKERTESTLKKRKEKKRKNSLYLSALVIKLRKPQQNNKIYRTGSLIVCQTLSPNVWAVSENLSLSLIKRISSC